MDSSEKAQVSQVAGYFLNQMSPEIAVAPGQRTYNRKLKGRTSDTVSDVDSSYHSVVTFVRFKRNLFERPEFFLL